MSDGRFAAPQWRPKPITRRPIPQVSLGLHSRGGSRFKRGRSERLGLGGVLVADHSIGGHPGEGWGLIGSNNGLPTFAAVIRARHIAIPAEYHEGGFLAEMFAVWGRISSLFPLRL